MNKITRFFQNSVLHGIFFCIFNLLYVIVATFITSWGFLDFGRGISFPLLLTVNLNILIPIISVIIYVKNNTYRDFKRIYRLFFGIEMPLIFLCIFRIFFLSDITPFFFVLILSVLLTIIVQVIEYTNFMPLKKLKFMALGYETTVILSVYAFILSLFFICPIFWNSLKIIFTDIIPSFLKFYWLDTILNMLPEIIVSIPYILIGLIFGIFFLSIFVLFLLTPFLSLEIYLKGFKKYLKRIVDKKFVKYFAIIYFFVMAILSFQPNTDKLDKAIGEYKNAKTYEEKVQIAEKSILPYKGFYQLILTNKYLAKYRYFGDNTSDNVKRLYKNEKTGAFLQGIFNTLARPFIYNGRFSSSLANFDYQDIFDENIQLAQKKKVRKAVYSTLDRSDTASTLIDKDAKTVLLTKRKADIEIIPNLPVAKVRITEEYKNKSTTDKEVYYELVLPQGSVITDLKLGKNLEYQGKISPKGAARKTYERQVFNSNDPALLEKCGLRQYTLRVFPVPVRDTQKVSYEYITLIHDEKVELPIIYEKRNVFENIFTVKKYSVNKETEKQLNDDNIKIAQEYINCPVSINTNGVNLSFAPKAQKEDIKNKKIAFLLDTSFSNKTNWSKYLKKDDDFIKLSRYNTVDTYFFNDVVSNKTDINKSKQISIGKTKKLNAINQIAKNDYDLIVLLTDNSNFDSSERKSTDIKIPVYIIHTTSDIPPYFNELTDTVMKSGGDIEKNIEDVINDFSQKQQNNSVISADNDFVWLKGKSLNSVDFGNLELKKLAASKLIDEKIRTENIEDIQVLDKIHNIAKQYGIVTNYSSYIALVNKWQEKQLEQNEKSKDRYKANKKSGADRFVNDFDEDNDIKAVPEPEEWMMIILGLVLLILFSIYRKNYAKNN